MKSFADESSGLMSRVVARPGIIWVGIAGWIGWIGQLLGLGHAKGKSEAMDLNELQQYDWWPLYSTADIYAGIAGHDNEIYVVFEAYDYEHPVNDLVLRALIDELPESWKIEDRGSRVEIHPSGRLFGGYCLDDILAVKRALHNLGFVIGKIDNKQEA